MLAATPTRERALLASATARHGNPNHPEVVAARRAYHAARAVGVVRAIAADPVLTDDDRNRLAAILSPAVALAVTA